MTRYFRKVDDAQRLLPRERAPVTGRRVPKVRSKRGHDVPTARFAGLSIPVAAVVGGIVAVLVVAGIVIAVSSSGGSGTAAVSTTNATAVTTLPVVTELPAVTVPEPTTTTAVTSTSTTQALAVVSSIHLTSIAVTTNADVTPADPGATATYSGPLPQFNFGIDCTADGCDFSLRTFAPGTVNDEGLTTIPAVAGRFVSTSTSSVACTGSKGSRFVRRISSVMDLTLAGSQNVDGIAVPQQIGGTLTIVTPEAGYVPHVGDVVDQGAEIGCSGQTLVFTVAGDLAPTG